MILSRETDNKRIVPSDSTRGLTGHIKLKAVVSAGTCPWELTFCNKDISLLFPEILMICLHPTKNNSLRCYLCLMNNCMQKIWGINWFLPEILKIKEYCNLTENINEGPQRRTRVSPDTQFFQNLKKHCYAPT